MLKRLTYLLAVLALALTLLPAAGSVQAQSGNQWRMDFFNNPDWEGGPSLTQFATLINFNWGLGSPAPNVPVDNFTGRFTTDAWFYAGVYRFNILADDEFRLLIDGTGVDLTDHAARVRVEGHCDERGTTEYNLALGDRRAMAIRKYLSRAGVQDERLRTVSYGEERPLETESNEIAWSKNRRAEFKIIDR